MANFEAFYITWYSRAKNFAQSYVLSEADAENIVQDVFLHFYEEQTLLDLKINVVAYLFTSIKNKSMDFLRRKIVENEAKNFIQTEFDLSLQMKLDSLEILNTNFPNEESIEKRLDDALQKLPERCRQIFIMNKIEGKKQKQIADELQISVNTVETQMAIAYKKLRDDLKDCIPLLMLLIACGVNK